MRKVNKFLIVLYLNILSIGLGIEIGVMFFGRC